MRSLPLPLLTLSLIIPVAAGAQDTRRIEMSYETTAPKCPNVSTAGLATAVGVSALGIAGGSVLAMAGGSWDLNGDGTGTQRNTAMIATGSTVALLSAAGVAIASWRLHVKKKKKSAHKRGHCEQPVVLVPGVRF
jgi:hypothetical protein